MAASPRNLWYWAWLVQVTVPKRGRMDHPAAQVWRNLVLVQAKSAAEALRKAEAIGQRSAGDADGTLLLEGEPAQARFLGIEDAGLVDDRLSDGVEVMFQLDTVSTSRARSLARPRSALLARLGHETRHLQASNRARVPAIARSR